MDLKPKGIKGIALSLLRYYTVIICTFAISVPLVILGIAVSLSLADLVTTPEAFEFIFYPFLLGFCFLAMLPIILIGVIGNYFLLFFNFKRGPQFLRRAGARPFRLPPVKFSMVMLGTLIFICIPAYLCMAIGVIYFNPATLGLLLIGTIVLVIVFPFMFTFPPIMWIEILQKGKKRMLGERSILTALAWGMFSPVPVIFVGLLFDVIYHSATGSAFPDWMDTALMAPLLEELFKALGLVLLLSRIRNQYDGLVLGFCCGVGFAVVENLVYFGGTAVGGFGGGLGGAVFSWTFIIIVRSLKSTMSHGLGTAIIGFTLGYLMRELRNGKGLWFLPVLGYIFAVVLHAVWNGFIVFLDKMVPENFQNSLVLVLGMMVWIVSFFFMELFLLLLLKFVSRNAENDDLKKRTKRRRPRPTE